MALPVSNKTFLGVGWSFPVAQAGGQAAMVQYEEDIRQAILIILLTNNDERIMRPTFGAGLSRFLFEPVNPTTMAELQLNVRYPVRVRVNGAESIDNVGVNLP